jgi:hypothetical protein
MKFQKNENSNLYFIKKKVHVFLLFEVIYVPTAEVSYILGNQTAFDNGNGVRCSRLQWSLMAGAS